MYPVDRDEFEEWCERGGGDFREVDPGENRIHPEHEEVVCEAPGGGEVRMNMDGDVTGWPASDEAYDEASDGGDSAIAAYWWKTGKMDSLGGSDFAIGELHAEGHEIDKATIGRRESSISGDDMEDHLKVYKKGANNIGFYFVDERGFVMEN